MWTYSQRTGYLRHGGEIVGTGYAGFGEGKNDPAKQEIPNVGPLPRGIYRMGKATTHPHLGPVTIKLFADQKNMMYGRDGFYIHGQNRSHPNDSSHGCPVFGRDIRAKISESEDRVLLVIEG